MNKKGSVNEKHLLIALLCLVVIIVGLVVAIVIINYNQSGNEIIEELDDTDDGVSCYYDDDDDENVCEDNTEQIRSENEMMKAIENIEKEEQTMVDRGSIDINRINRMYDDAIQDATVLQRNDYVFVLISSRTDFLKENGLQKDALDALLKTNFDLFLDPDKYRLYSEIIEIADSINDAETSSRYRQLLETVADEYWADYRGTESTAQNMSEAEDDDDDENEEEDEND